MVMKRPWWGLDDGNPACVLLRGSTLENRPTIVLATANGPFLKWRALVGRRFWMRPSTGLSTFLSPPVAVMVGKSTTVGCGVRTLSWTVALTRGQEQQRTTGADLDCGDAVMCDDVRHSVTTQKSRDLPRWKPQNVAKKKDEADSLGRSVMSTTPVHHETTST